MNPVYHIAICGLGFFKNVVGNYAWTQVTDKLEAQKVHEIYSDSLRYRGWQECPVDDSDEVVGDYIEKFEKDGHVRYVVRWEDVR